MKLSYNKSRNKEEGDRSHGGIYQWLYHCRNHKTYCALGVSLNSKVHTRGDSKRGTLVQAILSIGYSFKVLKKDH